MRSLAKQARRLSVKQGPPGQDVGWVRPGAYSAGPARIKSLLGVYGGTDESVGWVYDCASLISDRLAAYDTSLHNANDGALLDPPPEDLATLLREPRERMTYFDFAALVGLDLELAGNSYWLMDQQNALGQPLALVRFRPELVQIATNNDGTLRGYVLNLKGRQIGYDADEVMHFKYPNPLDEHYGMGTLEALHREVAGDLAASQHVTGFFSDGARISGVLTINGTLGDAQFERLKREIQEEYGPGGGGDFSMLVAEQGMDYKPITAVPSQAGVIDVLRVSKDRILSGFGIPEFLLGGTAQGGVYKMEEAQHIMYMTMLPKTRRFAERITIDLVRRWGDLEFRVKPATLDPQSVRIERAKNMMGSGASINEGRGEQGLEPIDDPLADAVLLPTNLAPIGLTAPRKTHGDGNGSRPQALPVAGVKHLPPPQARTLDEAQAIIAAQLVAQRAINEKTGMSIELARDIAQVASAYNGAAKTLVPAPELPIGYEQRSDVKAPEGVDPAVVRELLDDHARVLRLGLDTIRPRMVTFFNEQHSRVLVRLHAQRPVGTQRARWSSKDVDPDDLWDEPAENDALLSTYLPAVDELGAQSLPVPARLVNTNLSWNLESPHIAAARDRLGEKIVRINETTRTAIAAQVEEGMRRGYSIPQLANGVPAEDYRGIAGVFQEATAHRAETIARSESAMIYNGAATAAYRHADLTEVGVLDGNGDGACEAANGQRWPIDRAEQEPIEHPNCVRAFVPVT